MYHTSRCKGTYKTHIARSSYKNLRRKSENGLKGCLQKERRRNKAIKKNVLTIGYEGISV